MLADSYILPECIVHPGSFGGLMTLYEANFIKLKQLVYDLHNCSANRISYSEQDCNLHLKVEDRSKYTCQIRLTYWFDDENCGVVAEPDLLAKVYFDARMVEVKGWVNTHRHKVLRNFGQRSHRPLDVCWTRNIMFSKWLDYLLDQGHEFPSAIL